MRCAAACLSLALAAPALAQEEVVYALDDYVFPSLLTLDPVTFATTGSVALSGHEALFGGLAVDAAGTLYSIDGYNDGLSDRLVTIDPATGQVTVVGDTGLNWNFRTIVVDPTTDTLYAATDNQLFTLNKTTGAATHIANITGPTLDQLTALAIDSQGNAYITDIGDTGLFSLNLQTGAATHLGNLGQSGNWFDDLAFNAEGALFGGRVQGGLYRIDVGGLNTDFIRSGIFRGLDFSGGDEACYPDFDGNGLLNLFDFLAYTNAFNAADPAADCDNSGALNLFDFLCFTNAFNEGC